METQPDPVDAIPDTPRPPITRIFPDTPGHNEDNGALLDLIIRALPADRLYVAAASVQALACAAAGLTPDMCCQPIID